MCTDLQTWEFVQTEAEVCLPHSLPRRTWCIPTKFLKIFSAGCPDHKQLIRGYSKVLCRAVCVLVLQCSWWRRAVVGCWRISWASKQKNKSAYHKKADILRLLRALKQPIYSIQECINAAVICVVFDFAFIFNDLEFCHILMCDVRMRSL